jgi:hypothetical protein
MGLPPAVVVPVKADTSGLVGFARVVARHMTALADELDEIAAHDRDAVHFSPGGDGQTASGCSRRRPIRW